MATIGDVARRAGVSRTAVSFAFNTPEQLAEETLQRILDVAYELGYYPNPAARSLNTGRTGILGVLIPECAAIVYANPFTLDFLKGVGRVSDRHGLTMLLVSPLQGSLTHAMNNVPVDGFITLGLGVGRREVELLHRRKVPFVVVDAPAPRPPRPICSTPATDASSSSPCPRGAGMRTTRSRPGGTMCRIGVCAGTRGRSRRVVSLSPPRRRDWSPPRARSREARAPCVPPCGRHLRRPLSWL